MTSKSVRRAEYLMTAVENFLPYWLAAFYARDLGGKCVCLFVYIMFQRPRDPSHGRHRGAFLAESAADVGTRLDRRMEMGNSHMQNIATDGGAATRSLRGILTRILNFH